MNECRNCQEPINSEHATCARCGEPMHYECATIQCSCGNLLCDVCAMTHDVTCEECENKSKVDLETVRRSHLELYKRCPYAFELEVIKGLGHQQTIYTQSGINLHILFDEYSKHDDGDAEEMFNRFMDEYEQHYPREWYTGYATYDKMLDRYKHNIEGFFEFRAQSTKPVITEQKIFLNVGDNLPTVNITMDRIDEEDGEYVLKDYKTGKVMVGKKLSTDLQAPLYILAVQANFDKPVKRFDFLYFGDGNKKRSFIRDENDPDKYHCQVNSRTYTVSLHETKKEVRSILDKITKGEFNVNAHQKQYNCRNCHFFEKECAGVDTETWRQARR